MIKSIKKPSSCGLRLWKKSKGESAIALREGEQAILHSLLNTAGIKLQWQKI